MNTLFLHTKLLSNIFIVLSILAVGLLVVTNERVSYAELEYVEYSPVLGEKGGGLIPASCQSSPPTSHFAGDCPVAVETGIAPTARTVSATLSPASQSVATQATISWTSSGATKCVGTWTPSWLPSSGSAIVSNGTLAQLSYSIRCTDGVFWSTLQTVTVTYNPPPDGTF